MRISRIKIENILGHELLEFSPKGITEISGPNGSGKSTVLKAIAAAFEGTKSAEQAQLIRKGASEGEVVVLLDDGLKVARRLDIEGKNALSVYDVNTKGRFNQGYLDSIVDEFALSPMPILTAKPADLADIVLGCIPLELDPKDLDAALGEMAGKLRTLPKGGHALVTLDAADKELRDQRKEQNRQADDRRKTVKTLTETLPVAPEGTDWGAIVAGLEAERDGLRAALNETTREAAANVAALREANADGFNAALKRASVARDEKIAEANRVTAAAREEYAQVEAKCTAHRVKLDAHAHADADAIVAAKRDEVSVCLEDIAAKLADAKAQNEEGIRAGATRKLIEDATKETDQAEHAAELRAIAIEKVAALKRKLTEKLPIEGLEIHGGAIRVNGIPFETLNTAQRVKIAIKIATERAGKLSLVCCDGIEALDADTRAELFAQAEASGLQLIVTRVSDEPFTIETR